MKRTLNLLLLMLLSFGYAMAQTDTTICITRPEGVEYGNTTEILCNSLTQAAVLNHLATSQNENARYHLNSRISTYDIKATNSTPIKFMVELEVFLTCTDTQQKRVLSECSFTVKGIGSSESRAYTQAIRQIRPRSVEMKKMMEKSRAAMTAGTRNTTEQESLLK